MKHYDDIENCPIAGVEKIVHGKWTMVVISILLEGTLRFSEIKRRLPNVTEANLTKELRLLEKHGLVHREVYKEVPPKVEYSLTESGKSFEPVIVALEQWALKYNQ